MTTNIARTVAFLKEQFEQSVYLANNPVQRKNRVEHALRVAAIGRQIAVEEGLNEEALVIGCLLHDLSYTERIVDGEASWINHGRRSVELARPFLATLDLSPALVNELCYGMAIHVDGKAVFPGEPTLLALSVGDADVIDQVNAYKLHHSLCRQRFLEKAREEQLAIIDNNLAKLAERKAKQFATKTAARVWESRIGCQVEFLTQLKAHIDASAGLS